MATATLTYNLNDLDDAMEHLRSVKATHMALALWEFAYNNRKSIENEIDKRLNGKQGITAYETLDLVYNSFWEIMKDNDLNIDKLIQ